MQINELKQQISERFGRLPELGCVLGSSWGVVGEFMNDRFFVPYDQIEGMPTCSVQGHKGGFSIGYLFGKLVILAEGRIHLYEGKGATATVMPVEVMYELGATKLLITNAAGGIRPDFVPGDFMVLCDHINLTAENPLVGLTNLGNSRFMDMSAAYDQNYVNMALEIGKEQGIPTHKGVYAQLLGPSFETPAEIRYLRAIGADAVGMSTAIEVIKARSLGLRVAAISCITNLAAGLTTTLSHEEVLAVSAGAKDRIFTFLTHFIPKL